eukprot:SAG25_NODE_8339_length_427_cov_0.475610_2_plen_47_part_01
MRIDFLALALRHFAIVLDVALSPLFSAGSRVGTNVHLPPSYLNPTFL